MMQRRKFLRLGTYGFVGTSLAGLLSQCSGKRQRPNILLFLVDDLGWQDTSVPFYKEETPFNKWYHTPNMERLARKGLKFTQAYACPVCSPTRVSLLCGMNAAHHRVTNWTLRKNVPAVGNHPLLKLPDWNVNGLSPVPGIERTIYATPLPELLRDAGYFTIHCGKAHFGAIGTPGADPLQLGFDVNIAGHAAGAPGSYYGMNNFDRKNAKEPTVWAVPGLEKYHGKEINLTEALTREAIAALDKAVARGKPFFLYMAHYAVHTPIEPDKRFVGKYRRPGVDPREAAYASMVEAMDKSLGDLMDYLERKGIADNTIILFMSDNGGLSAVARGGKPHTHNKPLSSGKGSLREGGIRVPMLAYWPGVTPATGICRQPVIIEDFFPTILDLAGIRNYDTAQQIDGVSFAPLLKGEETQTNERALFWHYPNRWGPTGPGIEAGSVVRKGEWKLIYYHADRSFELFNLADDIGETRNLVNQYPEKASELAMVLGDYLRGVKAQMPADKQSGKIVPWPDEALSNQLKNGGKIKETTMWGSR